MTMINYSALAERLYGKPHLATPTLLRTASYLVENEYLKVLQDNPTSRKDDVTVIDGVGFIDIKGTLVDEEGGWDTACGITSYDKIQGEFEYLVESGIKEVVFTVNSGGGEAYGAFEGADYVRDLANQNDVKITTYIDSIAASGGYVWASIADEIVINPMAETGSIGVVVQLMNNSRMLKENGYDRVFVYSGDQKIPFDENGDFKDEFIADVQASVDTTYLTFVNHVAKHRNLSVESVKATQARVFSADEALKLGLVDRIETRKSFLKSLETRRSKEKTMSLFSKQVVNPEQTQMIEDLNAEKQSLQQELEAEKGLLTEAKEKIQSLESEKQSLESQLATAKEKLEDFEKIEAEKVKTSRVAKISALVAEDQVEGLYQSTLALDDAALEVVLQSLGAKRAEAKEEMKELGSGGGADVKDVAPKSHAQSLVEHIKKQKAQKVK